MKSGKWPKECKTCERNEHVVGASYRTSKLAPYPDLQQEELPIHAETSMIERIDLRLGTNCNLKCRMCSPYSSSLWHEDWEKLGDEVTAVDREDKVRLMSNWENQAQSIDSLKSLSPNLKEIYITGGEPLLSPGHKKYLLSLIEQNLARNITLKYTSNATVYDENLVKLWDNFKDIRISLSVDARGALNNYIRYPSQWERILQTVEKYQKTLPGKLKVRIHCTVQAYNILHIKTFYDFFVARGLDVDLTPLNFPEYLAANVLPTPLAELARHELSKSSHEKVLALIPYVQSQRSDLWPKFCSYTDKLDGIRGQSVFETLPEFESYWSETPNNSPHLFSESTSTRV